MVETMVSFLGNNIVQQIGGALLGLFVGGVGVWIYVQSGLSNAIKTGGKKAGNFAGLFMWNNVVKQIKDINLRNKLIEDLDTAGNDFDLGWSKGVRGVEI